jgi:hypothetical protein
MLAGRFSVDKEAVLAACKQGQANDCAYFFHIVIVLVSSMPKKRMRREVLKFESAKVLKFREGGGEFVSALVH